MTDMSKQTEALKLALEALKSCDAAHITDGGRQWYDEKLVDKAVEAIEKALADQPAPVQQGGLEMVDDEGENQAVRMFLALYGGACGVTSEQMRKHLKMAGFDGAWPEWANSNNGHLTKAGAQLWIRHLFALAEQPAHQHIEHCLWARNGNQPCPHVQPAQQQEPVAVVSGYYGGQCVILPIDPARIFNSGTVLYTSPQAQRTWVGLTDDERLEVAEIDGADEWFWKVCKAIEAKLKEKNT